MSARRTLRLMHTQHLTTVWTGPLLVFVLDELSDADLLNAGQIGNWTRAVFGAVTLVEVFHTRTREFVALMAILESSLHQGWTILHTACNAVRRFCCVIDTAARAGVLAPDMGGAQTTVDAARCDQNWTS